MKVDTVENSRERTGSGALFAGGLAAILASTCCLGPLVLIALGVSGAWIGNLTKLEPYRPLFIVGAIVALIFAGRQIFRTAQTCNLGEVCAVPRTRRIYKVLFVVVSMLVLVALVFPYLVKFFY
jgi:mercuric ion transport protein